MVCPTGSVACLAGDTKLVPFHYLLLEFSCAEMGDASEHATPAGDTRRPPEPWPPVHPHQSLPFSRRKSECRCFVIVCHSWHVLCTKRSFVLIHMEQLEMRELIGTANRWTNRVDWRGATHPTGRRRGAGPGVSNHLPEIVVLLRAAAGGNGDSKRAERGNSSGLILSE